MGQDQSQQSDKHDDDKKPVCHYLKAFFFHNQLIWNFFEVLQLFVILI